MLNTD